MPSIGIACCTFQCGLAVAGNPYGRTRSLDGFGSKTSVFHVVVLSFEGNGIRPPQRLEEFKCFVGAGPAVMKVLVQNFEFLFEPADTKTKHKTPLRQLIDFSDLFGNFERVVHRQYHNTGAEFQSTGFRCQVTDHRKGFPVALLPVFGEHHTWPHRISGTGLWRQYDVGTAPQGIDLKRLSSFCDPCKVLRCCIITADNQ